jgi:NAD(P)-dependent dehydrogenase (short-subunit alcohol dehydrogenase family)
MSNRVVVKRRSSERNVNRQTNQACEQASLLRRIKGGDEGAFLALVDSFAGHVLTLARQLTRNEELAADALIRTFLKAYGEIDCLPNGASLWVWLTRTVVAQSIEIARRQVIFAPAVGRNCAMFVIVRQAGRCEDSVERPGYGDSTFG